MQKYLSMLLLAILPALLVAKSDLKKGFVQGDPGIKSVNALAFGPEGILFIGDSKNAMVYAIDTKDTRKMKAVENTSIRKVDETIAAKLGTEPSKIHFQDMAVNPHPRISTWPSTTTTGLPCSCASVRIKNWSRFP